MTHFFKKATPAAPIILTSGQSIYFERINSMTGVYRTDNEDIVNQFSAMQRQARGGIFTITEEEYNGLLKKKLTPSQQNWRDTFGKGNLPMTQRPENDLVSRAAEEGSVKPSAPAAPAEVAPKIPEKTGFRPQARK
jgi:hypothetical protein